MDGRRSLAKRIKNPHRESVIEAGAIPSESWCLEVGRGVQANDMGSSCEPSRCCQDTGSISAYSESARRRRFEIAAARFARAHHYVGANGPA